jgi:NNP family nitrate/nitrite transporter-like MFS transporter
MLLLCDDTPTGRWSDRHVILQGEPVSPPPEMFTGEKIPDHEGCLPKEKPVSKATFDIDSVEHQTSSLSDSAQAEVVIAPTFREGLSVIFNLHTLALAAPYACSFGKSL